MSMEMKESADARYPHPWDCIQSLYSSQRVDRELLLGEEPELSLSAE